MAQRRGRGGSLPPLHHRHRHNAKTAFKPDHCTTHSPFGTGMLGLYIVAALVPERSRQCCNPVASALAITARHSPVRLLWIRRATAKATAAEPMMRARVTHWTV